MSTSIKSFSVGYNPINQSNTFCSGDFITGHVTLELVKECKIDSLFVKLKGKAEVQWVDSHGSKYKRHFEKEKYFSIKEFIITDGLAINNIGPGCHVYPFSVQIPAKDLPSSFKSTVGKIVYTVEAILSRSKKLDCNAKEKFTVVCKDHLNADRTLMNPQRSVTEKKMKVFTSGTLSMEVSLERTGYHQGEGMKVVALIQNKSSRDVKPKYCLYMKCSYFAKGERKLETKDIQKEAGEVIPPSTSQTVTKIITIPLDACASILNCDILRVEYRLKVYLDVKYHFDPEIKFPVVILPALQGADGAHVSAHPAFGLGAFASSDMPGENSYLQYPSAPGPSASPPAYVTYGNYPPWTDEHEKF